MKLDREFFVDKMIEDLSKRLPFEMPEDTSGKLTESEDRFLERLRNDILDDYFLELLERIKTEGLNTQLIILTILGKEEAMQNHKLQPYLNKLRYYLNNTKETKSRIENTKFKTILNNIIEEIKTNVDILEKSQIADYENKIKELKKGQMIEPEFENETILKQIKNQLLELKKAKRIKDEIIEEKITLPSLEIDIKYANQNYTKELNQLKNALSNEKIQFSNATKELSALKEKFYEILTKDEACRSYAIQLLEANKINASKNLKSELEVLGKFAKNLLVNSNEDNQR